MADSVLSFRAPADSDRPVLAEVEAMVAGADFSRAAARVAAVFPAGLDHPLVLMLLAQRRDEAGRHAEALPLLRRAQALAPGDVRVLSDLGHCLFQLGRSDEAIGAFDAALALAPDDLAALCNKAAALLALHDRPGGTALYERAAAADPRQPEPLAALAALTARFGEPAAARDYAARALAIDPRRTPALMALAEVDVREREFTAAETRLGALLADPSLPPEDRVRAFTLLGDALDGLDRPADAFAAYARANETSARQTTASAPAGESPAAFVQRLNRYFDRAPSEPWRSSPGADPIGARAARRHVFLVGFPRSGTTLLEQALASHPDVVSLEETSALAEPSALWMADDLALDRLGVIGQADANRSREAYWRAVRGMADPGDGGKVVVDKVPLHTVRLPLIAKLFPDALILFARRDPRDVVFSCFRRRIGMNSTLDEFSTLHGAADYYDGVMRLAERYLAVLPLRVAFVRHEDMVADFQGEMTRILGFVGLAWRPEVLGFAARAQSRSKTPSAAQVAKGLNADGLGQWRRFAVQLAPILPRIAPWALRFGYEAGETAAPPQQRPMSESDPSPAALEAVQQLIGRGDFPRAMLAAEEALARGLHNPLLYKLRALRREQQGRPDLAIPDFERALADAPADFATLNALGLSLAKAGRLPEALAHLRGALAIAPTYAPAHYNHGWTLENTGDLVAAGAAYERALRLEPGHAQAAANLAALAVRASDWGRARAFADRALSADPRNPTAAIALAQVELAAEALAEAETRLRSLIADTARASLHDRSVALTTLGDVLDRRERPDEAFAAYEAANAGLRTLAAPRFNTAAESSIQRVRRLADEFALTAAADWTAPDASRGPRSPAANHVFVVGFPRSGTTLLGQVLQRHPDVVTLDEQETLIDASQAFLSQPGGLARLAESGDDALDVHRAAYWRRVREAGAAPEGKTFVDKLPMNSLGLPLIARLFPEARVLFVRRDPRDVALSAFRRQFVVNSATWELLTLDGAAAFYDAVMRLSQLYLERLPLAVRVQSYEALVADFDAESAALGAFAGLDWTRAGEDFGAAARGGGIATPSAGQIARGLYGEGVGQWRRYERALAPALPTLQPWIDAFGY